MGNRHGRSRRNKPFTSKYDISNERLGKGSYGTVYTCTNKETRIKYAVKTIEINPFRLKILFHINNEGAICSYLKHENIAKYYESFSEKGWRYMVFEKVQGRYLFAEICAMEKYSERDARNYMEQILNAVQYCHQRGIVHRDLKPTNILLQPGDNKIKLIDFGLSIITRGTGKYWYGRTGCPLYMAPEIVAEMIYEEAVDMWSCGLLLYNLVSGIHPFVGILAEDVFREIRSGRVDYPIKEFKGISVDCINLIRSLLSYDDNERLTAEEALDHEFIDIENVSSTSHRQLTIDGLKEFHVRAWQTE